MPSLRLSVAERVQWEGFVTDSRAAKGRGWRSRMLLNWTAPQRLVCVENRRDSVCESGRASACRGVAQWLKPVRQADTIALVHDNLNTHKLASLDAAFPPAEARRLIDKLEIHDTPKHGSWLGLFNEYRAEIELGVLIRQCLDRRIPDLTPLTQEVAAWELTRNAEQVQIQWQFTTTDARVKLKRLSPVTEPIKLKLVEHSWSRPHAIRRPSSGPRRPSQSFLWLGQSSLLTD